MTLFLRNYKFSPRMCVVAYDRDLLLSLSERNYEVMYIQDNAITFYPDEISITVEADEMANVRRLENRDIVEIFGNGLLYRSFANMETDSALLLGASCNSNCVMCPASDNERRKGFSYTLEQVRTFISYLPEDLEALVITGGEPTLYPDTFIAAMRSIKEKFTHTQVLLLSNGRALSNTRYLDTLCDNSPKNFTAAIPIHGDTPALHDSITRAEGSFSETLLAISKILARRIPVELRKAQRRK